MLSTAFIPLETLGAVRVGDYARFSLILMTILGFAFWQNRGRIYSGIGRLGIIDQKATPSVTRLQSRFTIQNRRFFCVLDSLAERSLKRV